MIALGYMSPLYWKQNPRCTSRWWWVGIGDFRYMGQTFSSYREELSSKLCCSVAQSCPTLYNPMGCSSSGFLVLHHLPELAQTHALWVGNTIQPSHPLSSSAPPALNLSQHQGLFQWASSSHQVAKVLELQLQHEPFQWIFRVDFL